MHVDGDHMHVEGGGDADGGRDDHMHVDGDDDEDDGVDDEHPGVSENPPSNLKDTYICTCKSIYESSIMSKQWSTKMIFISLSTV